MIAHCSLVWFIYFKRMSIDTPAHYPAVHGVGVALNKILSKQTNFYVPASKKRLLKFKLKLTQVNHFHPLKALTELNF